MKMSVITIGREYGSGGREIGRKVAEALGVDFYDKELINGAARESGLDQKLVEELEETRSALPFFDIPTLSQPVGGGYTAPLTVQDRMYLAQSNVIKQAADKGPCVIVGRAANHVLADRDDCLNVFIFADRAFRIGQIALRTGESEAEAKKKVARMDRSRAAYYHYYTGNEWGQADNYHICLNSGFLGIEGCVKNIVGQVKGE